MELPELARFIEEQGIRTVEVGFADLPGVLRGKRLSARHFLASVQQGIAHSKAVFVWDLHCKVFPGPELANFENGFRDMLAIPDLTTFRKIPWRPGSALVLCDLYDVHGKVVDVAPREILKRQVQRANDLGFRPVAGAELEFYLLNGEHRPVYNGIQCYSLYRGAELEFVLEEIRSALEELGIHVEGANTEYGPGQVEINLAYDDALAMADKTVLFKNCVKEIARKHGLYATFMAKPWAEESGNGFHIHQSLWDLQRQTNVFADDETLSRNYLAGLLSTSRDFMAFGSPSINSYKRFQDRSFAPVNVTWGYDNRTVATRSLLGHGNASRFEHRTGSADANPYLIIAANIAAGLYGIAHRLVPPAITVDNAYVADAPLLPANLRDSLNLLEASTAARESFDASFLDLFLSIGRHEVSLYDGAVTDWERHRYLEMA